MLLLLLPVLPARARGKPEAWANTQFSAAERMREELNNLPASERSRHEYQRVIAAYRRVYYGSPASGKADPSAFAVAQLLAEMGRCFSNEGALHAAVGQYKFLRREYPGSRNRFEALFNIGQIYQDDLKAPARAKPVFEEFLRRYPRSPLADAARQALAQPVQRAGLSSKDMNADEDHAEAPSPSSTRLAGKELQHTGAISSASANGKARAGNQAPDPEISRVTNVRHWSNPNYTRVAIDLDRDVKFESQRIEHPERIFFDLLDTNLATPLAARTFGLTTDC